MSKFMILFAILFLSYAQAGPTDIRNSLAKSFDNLHKSFGELAGPVKETSEVLRQAVEEQATKFETGMEKGIKTFQDILHTIAQKARNKDLEGYERFTVQLNNAKKEINGLLEETKQVISNHVEIFHVMRHLEWLGRTFSGYVENANTFLDTIIDYTYKRQDSDIV